jgi:hypothetical protein
MKKEELWVFELWQEEPGDKCFVEKVTPVQGMHMTVKCIKEGGWRREAQHTCGIGKGWVGEWRHLSSFEVCFDHRMGDKIGVILTRP